MEKKQQENKKGFTITTTQKDGETIYTLTDPAGNEIIQTNDKGLLFIYMQNGGPYYERLHNGKLESRPAI